MAVNFRVSFLIKWKDQKRMEDLKNFRIHESSVNFCEKSDQKLVNFPARVKRWHLSSHSAFHLPQKPHLPSFEEKLLF